MDDDLDPYAHDQDLLDEIHLLTELVIAATNNIGQLPQVRIDDILGVESARAECLDDAAEPASLPRQRDSRPSTVDCAGVRNQEHAQS
ncbi:MAG: hypothetical protein WBV37_04010 [Nocardioidaceae bacterium]